MLTLPQREKWSAYLNQNGIAHVFFSAAVSKAEQEVEREAQLEVILNNISFVLSIFALLLFS
jgi:hypothetical protein